MRPNANSTAFRAHVCYESQIIFTNYCQGIKRYNENLKLPDDVRSTINASVKALSPEMKIGRKVKLFHTFVV